MRKRVVVVIIGAFLVVALSGLMRMSQAQIATSAEEEDVRDGVYQITLNTPEERQIVVPRLVRDRDLNPSSLYRVSTGGYLGFDESEWIRDMQFKVFEVPVTTTREYSRYANLLVEINRSLWAIKRMLRSYDEISLRLMNICDRSMFPNLRSIDQNVSQQLKVYRNLQLLRAMVTNSLEQFVRERACADKFEQYQSDIGIYSKRLKDLTENYENLKRQVLESATVTSAGSSERKRPAVPPPPPETTYR